jgi:hypothetical protein
VVTPALNGTTTVHVHVIFLDIPFRNREQSPHQAATGSELLSGLRVCGEISRKMANGGESPTVDPENEETRRSAEH